MHSEISLHTYQNGKNKTNMKNLVIPRAGEDVEQLELSHIAGFNKALENAKLSRQNSWVIAEG